MQAIENCWLAVIVLLTDRPKLFCKLNNGVIVFPVSTGTIIRWFFCKKTWSVSVSAAEVMEFVMAVV